MEDSDVIVKVPRGTLEDPLATEQVRVPIADVEKLARPTWVTQEGQPNQMPKYQALTPEEETRIRSKVQDAERVAAQLGVKLVWDSKDVSDTALAHQDWARGKQEIHLSKDFQGGQRLSLRDLDPEQGTTLDYLLFHELGHAVDHMYGRKWRTGAPTITGILGVSHRDPRRPAIEKEAKALISHLYAPFRDLNWEMYASQPNEIIADAVALYLSDPQALREVAPTIAGQLDELFAEHVTPATGVAAGGAITPEPVAPPAPVRAEAPGPSPAVPVTTKPGGKPDVAWTRNLKAGDPVRVKGRDGRFTVVDATKDPSLVSLKSESGAELKVGRAALEPAAAAPAPAPVATQAPTTTAQPESPKVEKAPAAAPPAESAQPAPAETSASAAEKPSFKEGDRVTYTGRKGEKLTGTVRSVDSDGEASVDVDQVRTAGGVPIGRVEYVPVSRLLPADQPQQESAAFPVETKNIPLIRYQKEEGPATFSDVRGGIWFARINNIHGEKTGYEKTFGPTGGQYAVKETYTPKNPLLIVDTESAGAGDAAIRRLKSEAYLDRILDMWASDKLGAFLKAEFGVPDEQVQALLSHPDRIQAILDRVGTELARRAGYDSIIHTTPNGVYTEVVKLEKPSTGATTTAVTAAVPVQPEPKPETPAATGIQVRENKEKDGVEIKFPGRPSDATILKLREQGFRWHKIQKLWYAQRTPERLAFARSLAGGEAQPAAPEKKEPQPPATNTQPKKRILETGGSEDGGATGPVRPDGRGALEEAPAQDVSRPEAGGQAAAGPVRRAGEDQGGNRRPAGEGPGLSPGVGNGPGGLATAAGRGEQAEPRHESRNLDTARTVAGNYIITEADHLGEGGPKAKVRQNLDVIRLVKKLEQEGRLATPEEQAVLVKYVGWGAFPQLFAYYGAGYNEWAAERKELQELLTEKELEAARASTTNAHYTSRQVIDAIYQGIRRLGFDGGRVLEPSMGSGNFFGLMPTDMAAHAKLTGVELDNITGAIAKQLYPRADIRVMGFEETTLPDNFYDLAVSNVPFGNYKLHDPKYTKYNLWIHDYFFAKAMDKVRPGGIVAFITSTGTMNTPHSKTIRKMMADQADLLLAVRLPGEAFKENAGTEVTTDILFLQKREPGTKPKGEAWLETAATGMTSPYNGQPLMVNEYFARHPDRMLGKLVDDKLHPGRAALAADGRDMQKALAEAMAELPEGAYVRRATHKVTEEPEAKVMVPAPDHVKQGAYAVKEGKVLRRVGDMMESVEMEADTADRIKGMIQVRDAVRDLFRAQYGEADQAAVGAAQKHLNKTYDTFVKKNGALHSKANRKAYESDPDLPLLLALENWDSKTKTATKTDIFTKRTLQHQKQITAVETAKEALVVSLNERGRIDWARMTSLTGKPAETLQDNLKGLVFKNPEGDWEPADQYLSGNVRQKLAVARAAAANDPAFLDNISALEAVQPEDLTEAQIAVKLGAAWMPPDYVQEFLASLLNVNSGVVSVQHNTGASVWTVETTAYARNQVVAQQKWGTSDLDAIDLVEMALNNRIPTVRRTDPDTKKSWVDQEATLAARAKLDEIKTEFQTWLWKDANRKAFAVRKYNDEFNSIRPRTFDGSHLTLPGMAAHITLRPHQKDAIWRVIQTGNTLLGHEVGAGKTWEMAGAAMELRRLGLAKKPMFVVPNHLIEQWPKEFLELYPGANILAAGKDDFKPEKRQELMSRIATGDWDAVIVPHSSFEKIPMSEQVIEGFFQEQIAELEAAILQERSGQAPQYGRGRKKDSRLVKELEKSKKRLETKMKDRLDKRRKDKTVDFEELGVDALFVDEAHEFKNLWYVTRMTRVAGLPNSEANKTFDLYMKTSYLNKLTGSRGVVFATGTPISNTMAEMFHMMRYLMPDAIKAYGIHNFDAWANLFGEIVPILELSPEGKGLRVNNRFARFVNLPELLRLFFETADIKTFEMLAETDPELAASRPEAETITIASPASAPLQQFIETLVARAELIWRGGIDGKQDNMLLVTTDGRKVALDLRMIDPGAPDLPDSKVNQVVNGVFKEWQDGKKDRLTQLIFLDLAKPKSAKGKKKEAKTEEAQEELDIADLLEDQDYNPDFNPYDEM
ncbi:MAG: DEAD/DEAH box helicase family protein, partial [Firmicutes bacterium]|nr:DEAD/DEAH box helicase family protein [Bacillota bacterium]